jgi:hypothetical protein
MKPVQQIFPLIFPLSGGPEVRLWLRTQRGDFLKKSFEPLKKPLI